MAPTMYTALDDHPSLDSLITPHHMFKNLTAVAIGGIDISSTDMDFPGKVSQSSSSIPLFEFLIG